MGPGLTQIIELRPPIGSFAVGMNNPSDAFQAGVGGVELFDCLQSQAGMG
jgi:hypothetical protein